MADHVASHAERIAALEEEVRLFKQKVAGVLGLN